MGVHLKAGGVAACGKVEDGFLASTAFCRSFGEVQHAPCASSALSSRLLFQCAMPAFLFTPLQAAEL